MMWSAGNPIDANFWNKVGTIWPFFVALVLNFALIFTENEWIKNKYNYLVLYLPAVAFFSYRLVKLPNKQATNNEVLGLQRYSVRNLDLCCLNYLVCSFTCLSVCPVYPLLP